MAWRQAGPRFRRGLQALEKEKLDDQLFPAVNAIGHTKTTLTPPRTNGGCGRFRKTILQECCQAAFRKQGLWRRRPTAKRPRRMV